MPELIGIGGYATAGKDALADILVDNHGWYKTYFSKPLHESLLALDPQLGFGSTYRRRWELFNHDYAAFKKHPEVRRLLQVMGTEVGRDMFDPNLWVKLIDKEVRQQHRELRNVVVTGVRFPNELQWLQSSAGDPVWISRPGVGPANGHTSEGSVSPDQFMHLVHNDGTLKDLERAAARLHAVVTA